MADTLGSLIDKLFTVDTKMWNNQEILYKIRKMSFDEFKIEYFSNDDKIRELWDKLKIGMDLNVQRNNLIDEIDSKIVEIVMCKNEEDLDKFVQNKYKTY